MPRYTVVWHISAEAKLAKLWNESFDRRAIASASNAIDARLKLDPASHGMPSHADTRTLVIYPLVALFRIREEDRMVEVIDIELDTSHA
jgi:hypothetical protein